MTEVKVNNSASEIQVDETIDCYGLLCPMPIVETARKVKELSLGQVLEVLSTDEGIKEDMPAWCEATGHEYLGVTEANGEYHVFLRKAAD